MRVSGSIFGLEYKILWSSRAREARLGRGEVRCVLDIDSWVIVPVFVDGDSAPYPLRFGCG